METSNAGSLHWGSDRTHSGLSHSWDRPTSESPAPRAQTISVPLARRETTRIHFYSRIHTAPFHFMHSNTVGPPLVAARRHSCRLSLHQIKPVCCDSPPHLAQNKLPQTVSLGCIIYFPGG